VLVDVVRVDVVEVVVGGTKKISFSGLNIIRKSKKSELF
jgi:hypothetical protein